MIATIDSVDVTSYLLSFVKDSSACSIGATGVFRLVPTYPNTILAGKKAYFELDSIKYSGWITSVNKVRSGQPIIVNCSDMVPLLDYFFDSDYIIEEDTDVATVTYNVFSLVGMNSVVPEEIGYTVKGGSNFVGYSGQAIIQHLLSQSGERYVCSDGNWKALYLPLKSSTPINIYNATEISTYRSDDWIRNEMVVIGMENGNRIYTKRKRKNSILDPEGHIKRGIISNPQYDSHTAIIQIAEKALDFYSRLLYVKSITSIGDTLLSLGDTVIVKDYTGIVTNLKQSVYGSEIIQEFEMDNRCQAVWGWTGRTPKTSTFEIHNRTDNNYSETVG